VDWLLAIVTFPLGLALGSFMTVVTARVPAGESVVQPRSRCPTCGVEIANRDNVPILGWALLRGRCLVVARLAGAPVDLVRMIAGFALFGGALFVVALVSRGMGMGDVKLASLIGLVLGSLGLRYVGVAAGAAIALGGVGAIVALLMGRGRKAAIPFGPYLAAGAIVAAFWGSQIADWYLRTFVRV